MAHPEYRSGLSAALDTAEPSDQDLGELELLELEPLEQKPLALEPLEPEPLEPEPLEPDPPSRPPESRYIWTAICADHGPYVGTYCSCCTDAA